MGGFVALMYALDHPDAVTALVLDSTAASYEYALDRESIWPAVTARARQGMPVLEAMRDAQRGDPLAVTDAAIADLETNNEALGAILNRLNEYDVRPRLAGIHSPALVLAGAHDRQCTPRQARELVAALPNAAFQLYPDIGHGVVHTGRADVQALVAEFITTAELRLDPTG
jgi:proline iminopeptidase